MTESLRTAVEQLKPHWQILKRSLARDRLCDWESVKCQIYRQFPRPRSVWTLLLASAEFRADASSRSMDRRAQARPRSRFTSWLKLKRQAAWLRISTLSTQWMLTMPESSEST